MITQSFPATATAEPKQVDFEGWLGERHKWLQTAAQKLVESRALPTEAEITELSKLCLAEATGVGIHPFTVVAPGSIVQAAKRPMLRLSGLSEVRGVNKIKDNASLTFGQGNLAVIYGANGSGKTGFSRVIKQACGSRSREDIHSNVFSKNNPEPEAKLSIFLDEIQSDIPWSLKGGALQQLQHVHVFDSKTAAKYIAEQNEAHYAPSRMRFINSLIKTSDKVSASLASQKAAQIKSLPMIPIDLAQTKAGVWLSLIRATTKPAEIDERTAYSAAMDEERIAGEAALAQKDIAGRLETIGRERGLATQVHGSLTSLMTLLSDGEISALLAARSDSTVKREAARVAAEQVFSNAALDGVGQQVCMALWTQAKLYSQAHAYPKQPFPVIDDESRCVLCQQMLDDDAKGRLGHFEKFVQSGLESAAKAADKRHVDLVNRLPALPEPKTWLLQVNALKMDHAAADKLLAKITTRRSVALTAITLHEVPPIDWKEFKAAYNRIVEALNIEEKALRDLQQDGKRKQLDSAVKELRGVQWLSQNNKAIEQEVKRQLQVALLDKAMSLAGTAMLTRKNNELANEELDKGYQKRFSEELLALGGKRLCVVPSSSAVGKGKTKFGLRLVGVERDLDAEKVLSEGEARIVALAAFLADIGGSGNPTPFIFDDPISSLDQDYEEGVVKRLLELSKIRQVIVFTHRLSLLALIESEVKKHKEESEALKMPPLVTLHLQALCHFGNQTGVIQDIRIRDLKPGRAINSLRDQHVPQLRKFFDAQDVAGYDQKASWMCSELRILVEKCVESVLLNDVLVRFRRSLQTQNRIGALAKIKAADCSMIDDFMTRYSVFEHSQSDELPAVLPDIDVIESDIWKLSAWLEEYEKRVIV